MPEELITLDGNEAAAYIAHLTNEVIAIYPITPASPMGEWADDWSAIGVKNLWDPSNMDVLHNVNQALRAHSLFQRDVDYVVKDGQVVREEQVAAYPQTNPDVPDLNPRGCQKGCAFSSFMYSEPRLTRPLRRKGETEHISRAVLHLLENDFITGQVLVVDGGENIAGTGRNAGEFDPAKV